MRALIPVAAMLMAIGDRGRSALLDGFVASPRIVRRGWWSDQIGSMIAMAGRVSGVGNRVPVEAVMARRAFQTREIARAANE
jgi:hypothetical protein